MGEVQILTPVPKPRAATLRPVFFAGEVIFCYRNNSFLEIIC